MNAAVWLLMMLCVNDISNVIAQRNASGNTRRNRQRKPQRSGNSRESLFTNVTQANCTSGDFACANGNCIAQKDVCDGKDSCGDFSDEKPCLMKSRNCWGWQKSCINGRCSNGTFSCRNGKCINTTDVCDKVDHCGDGTDERRAVVGFKCPMGLSGDICVLPQRLIKDNYTHCNNDADESETSDKHRKVFRCFDRTLVVSNLQQCDGVIDCPDLSDECPCQNRNEMICKRFCTGETLWGQANCTRGAFVCHDGQEIQKTSVCDGVVDCAGGIDEKYCRRNATGNLTMCPGDVLNTTQMLARLCDGRPECYDLSDECGVQCTSPLPGYCNFDISTARFHHKCPTKSGTFNVTVEDICNGKWSPCSPRVPQEEMNCTGRFYCKGGNPLSVDNSLTCNGYPDCEDASDEDDCPYRYKCSRGVPRSVPMRFVSDGIQDCKDGSDECPRHLDDQPIRSSKQLIALPFFQVWIWIVCICCLLGNGYIIASKIYRFKLIQNSNGLSKCNHFLVFNLSLADCIMGVYLLAISIKHNMVSGRYCRHDIRWRTSPSCFGLGVLTVISSETSVFMLTLLTTLRLISVHNPLKTRFIKFKWVALAAVIAWSVALLLALLPNSFLVAQYFRSGAFVPSKFVSSASLGLADARKFATAVSQFSPNSSAVTIEENWSNIASYLTANYPGHKIKYFYGYYSSYGTCMANFYPSSTDRVWGYSLGIVTFNFLIFVYIALAYVLIYKKATHVKVKSTADRSTAMQRKIIRLVVSDFCCWMPICIIAFLHSSGVIAVTGRIHALTAIVLLPINSVLNPFLYSDLVDIVWKKKAKLYQIFNSSEATKPTDLPVQMTAQTKLPNT